VLDYCYLPYVYVVDDQSLKSVTHLYRRGWLDYCYLFKEGDGEREEFCVLY